MRTCVYVFFKINNKNIFRFSFISECWSITGNKLLGKGFCKYLFCHGSDNIKRHLFGLLGAWREVRRMLLGPKTPKSRNNSGLSHEALQSITHAIKFLTEQKTFKSLFWYHKDVIYDERCWSGEQIWCEKYRIILDHLKDTKTFGAWTFNANSIINKQRKTRVFCDICDGTRRTAHPNERKIRDLAFPDNEKKVGKKRLQQDSSGMWKSQINIRCCHLRCHRDESNSIQLNECPWRKYFCYSKLCKKISG